MKLFFALLIPLTALAQTSLERGDAAFKKRGDPARAREALECYRKAHAAEPASTEAAWKLAAACQFVGFRLTKDDDQKLELFGEGRDVASAAAKANESCGPCHFWAGINRALYGQTSGIFRTIATLGIVKQNLEAAAEIDPSYAHGGPDRVLGIIDQKVPGILGGSLSNAEAHFEKAIAVAPENPLNYLFLAKLQKEEREDLQAVKATLARASLKVKVPEKDEVESYEAWGELKEMGADLKAVAEPAQNVQGNVGHVGASVDNG